MVQRQHPYEGSRQVDSRFESHQTQYGKKCHASFGTGSGTES
jgi:hypothetical protein